MLHTNSFNTDMSTIKLNDIDIEKLHESIYFEIPFFTILH